MNFDSKPFGTSTFRDLMGPMFIVLVTVLIVLPSLAEMFHS